MIPLDESEVAVLRMAAGRMTPAEMAFTLDISEAEFESRIAALLAKMDVTDFDTAVATAAAAGLLQTEL